MAVLRYLTAGIGFCAEFFRRTPYPHGPSGSVPSVGGGDSGRRYADDCGRISACLRCLTYGVDDAAYRVGLALEQQGLGLDALQVWEDFLEQAHSASVNERPMLNKILQPIAQLRAQLTPQDRGVNVVPVSSSAQSSLPKDHN